MWKINFYWDLETKIIVQINDDKLFTFSKIKIRRKKSQYKSTLLHKLILNDDFFVCISLYVYVCQCLFMCSPFTLRLYLFVAPYSRCFVFSIIDIAHKYILRVSLKA